MSTDSLENCEFLYTTLAFSLSITGLETFIYLLCDVLHVSHNGFAILGCFFFCLRVPSKVTHVRDVRRKNLNIGISSDTVTTAVMKLGMMVLCGKALQNIPF